MFAVVLQVSKNITQLLRLEKTGKYLTIIDIVVQLQLKTLSLGSSLLGDFPSGLKTLSSGPTKV